MTGLARMFRQSAVVALCCIDGVNMVLLITSRRRKRWVIPKGVVEPHLTPAASAAQEAYEEAGIRGDVDDEPIGRFCYEKWGGTCEVEVFRMQVTTILDHWPEQDLRDRRWVTLLEAARMVREPELAAILRSVAAN